MNEDGKKKYANGGFPPTGNFYIQQDSDLTIDDFLNNWRKLHGLPMRRKTNRRN